jgi:hypothetical protein
VCAERREPSEGVLAPAGNLDPDFDDGFASVDGEPDRVSGCGLDPFASIVEAKRGIWWQSFPDLGPNLCRRAERGRPVQVEAACQIELDEHQLHDILILANSFWRSCASNRPTRIGPTVSRRSPSNNQRS